MLDQWVPIDAPEPALTLFQRGRSPRLYLSADAREALQGWKSKGPLRITIVRSAATRGMIAVGLSKEGVQVDQVGYASAARFTRKLGVDLPVTVKLVVDNDLRLLVGHLPTEKPMPLTLPPPSLEPVETGSLRSIVRQVSHQPLPDEDVAHEDTVYHDDEEDEDEGDPED